MRKLFLSLFIVSTAFAQSNISSTQADFYHELAQHWAPKIHHGTHMLDKKKRLMNPRDAMIGYDFDNDNDIRTNPANINRKENGSYAYPLKAQAQYFVRESLSHYYIVYSFYHAYDGKKIGGHPQDSEKTFYVIKKNTQLTHTFGQIEFIATNAHGYAKIYSPDKQLETQLRKTSSRLEKSLPQNLTRRFITIIQPRVAKSDAGQHLKGDIEFSCSAMDGDYQTANLYISAKSHAIYKANAKCFEKEHGYVYSCKVGQEGDLIACAPMQGKENRELNYELVSFDQFFFDIFDSEDIFYGYNPEMMEAGKPFFYMSVKDMMKKKNRRIDAQTQLNIALLPKKFPNEDGSRSKASFIYNWGVKTYSDLRDPIAVHLQLTMDLKAQGIPQAPISRRYVYNPFTKEIKK